jgi:uncharacterized membrane protein YhdT
MLEGIGAYILVGTLLWWIIYPLASLLFHNDPGMVGMALWFTLCYPIWLPIFIVIGKIIIWLVKSSRKSD